MHNLLTKIFQKREIKSFNDLDTEEKLTFENWDKVLSKGELNIDDVKKFCQNQINIIENKWADYNLDENRKSKLLPYFTVYKMLLKAIDSPRSAREALEKNLLQLLEK